MFWGEKERISVVKDNYQRKFISENSITYNNLLYFIDNGLLKEWQIQSYFIAGVHLTTYAFSTRSVLCFYLLKEIIPVALTNFYNGSSL